MEEKPITLNSPKNDYQKAWVFQIQPLKFIEMI